MQEGASRQGHSVSGSQRQMGRQVQAGIYRRQGHADRQSQVQAETGKGRAQQAEAARDGQSNVGAKRAGLRKQK
jgi:hypothetical protein